MRDFDYIEFGNKIRDYRIAKGLTQEDLARAINKDRSLISKYEKGFVAPSADDIFYICQALEIFEADLFGNHEDRISHIANSSNPFKTTRLYMYFKAFDFRTKEFRLDKFIIDLEQKQDICKVKFIDYHDQRIYSEGYLVRNEEIAFLVMHNYAPSNPRVDSSLIEINFGTGVDKLMLAGYCGTNQQCEPSLRKCIVSQKDLPLTDDLLEIIKLDKNEMKKLEETGALYLDIFKI